MAGNEDEVDIEGVRRGRCLKPGCLCWQYYRRMNTASCSCGHTGYHHEIVRLCRGKINGDQCDCTQFRAPPAPYTNCVSCYHLISQHGGISGEGVNNRTSGIGIGGEGAGYRMSEAGGSLGTDLQRARKFAAERRSSDYARSVDSREARSARGSFCGTWGGRRPGSGRKSFPQEKSIGVTPVKMEPEKFTLTRVGFSHYVKMATPFSLDEFKESCRKEFSSTAMLDSTGGDKVFRRQNGCEILDSDQLAKVNFCYYYNSGFNAVEVPKRKRKSLAFSNDNDSSDEDNRHSWLNEDHIQDWKNGDVEKEIVVGNISTASAGIEVVAREEVHETASGSLSTESKVASEADFDPGITVMPKNSNNDFNEVAANYNVKPELLSVVADLYNNDMDDVQEFLAQALTSDRRIENALKLFRFYAFKVRDEDEDDFTENRVYMKLQTFDGDCGPSLQEQVAVQWKKHKNQFDKLANVKFDNGVGSGPIDSYLQVLRDFITADLFEGAADHRIPSSSTDLLMDHQFYYGGQLMGHIARHGKPVLGGVSDVVKWFFRGVPIHRLHVAMEDIPSYEIQTLLTKLSVGGEGEFSLTSEENIEINRLILDSGPSKASLFKVTTGTGLYQVKRDGIPYVVETIAQHIVILKRSAQIQQLLSGFNDVCKFGDFISLCSGEGEIEKSLADALADYYFPKMSDMMVSKEQLSAMNKVEPGNYQEPLCRCLAQVLDILEDDPKSDLSVGRFLQLCTANTHVPEFSVITWSVMDDATLSPNHLRFHVCSKSVDVGRGWFENDQREEQLVNYILSAVRNGYEGYALM